MRSAKLSGNSVKSTTHGIGNRTGSSQFCSDVRIAHRVGAAAASPWAMESNKTKCNWQLRRVACWASECEIKRGEVNGAPAWTGDQFSYSRGYREFGLYTWQTAGPGNTRPFIRSCRRRRLYSGKFMGNRHRTRHWWKRNDSTTLRPWYTSILVLVMNEW